jgi:hypothetical protein
VEIFASQGSPLVSTTNFATSTAGVVDTGGKFATGVNDTGGNFAAGDNDTVGKLPPVSNLALVLTIQVTNNGDNIRVLTI